MTGLLYSALAPFKLKSRRVKILRYSMSDTRPSQGTSEDGLKNKNNSQIKEKMRER